MRSSSGRHKIEATSNRAQPNVVIKSVIEIQEKKNKSTQQIICRMRKQTNRIITTRIQCLTNTYTYINTSRYPNEKNIKLIKQCHHHQHNRNRKSYGHKKRHPTIQHYRLILHVCHAVTAIEETDP